MKFFIAKIFILVFFVVSSNAKENIRFININYIVKNSEAGKALNKIVENKSKQISSELFTMWFIFINLIFSFAFDIPKNTNKKIILAKKNFIKIEFLD